MAKESDVSILGQLIADEQAAAVAAAGIGTVGSKPAAVDVAALERELAYERQRNNSLQGRMDAQIRPLTQTVRELRQQVDSVRATPATATVPVAQVTVSDLLAELTPADRELVGEKELAIMARLIEKPTQSALDRMRAELQQSFEAKFDARLRQVESQASGNAVRDLWDRVDQLSPGIRDRNDSDDPQWVEFLNQRDPISGRLRKELGNSAVDVGDIGRLALLHDEFLKATGKDKPAEEEPDRSSRLRPEGSRAEPAVSSGEKPSFTEADVNKFYKDLADGKYAGQPELVEKIESQVTEAIQDGRVVK
jgi:hypothetical protein